MLTKDFENGRHIENNRGWQKAIQIITWWKVCLD
jgi:hypothetical protein